jgi:hypothetical protein
MLSRNAESIYLTSNDALYQIEDADFIKIELPNEFPKAFTCASLSKSGAISVIDSAGVTIKTTNEFKRIAFNKMYNEIKLLCIDNMERTWFIADNRAFMTYQDRLVNVSAALGY